MIRLILVGIGLLVIFGGSPLIGLILIALGVFCRD